MLKGAAVTSFSSFALQFVGVTQASLASSGAQLIITESGIASGAPTLTGAQLAAFAAGGKTVLAYVNTSVTDANRSYWDAAWVTPTNPSNSDIGTITASAPAWLSGNLGGVDFDAANAGPDALIADYRNADWRALVIAQAVAQVNAGYGGVFLDDVGRYFEAASSGGSFDKSLADAMMQLVIDVAAAVRAINPNAVVVVNSGVYIGGDSTGGTAGALFAQYRAAIDGVLIENQFDTGSNAVWTAAQSLYTTHSLLAVESLARSPDVEALLNFAASRGVLVQLAPDDTYSTATRPPILGTEAGEQLTGLGVTRNLIGAGAGHDTIYGGFVNDTIYGHAGADLISVNLGNDLVFGGSENDTIYAGQGNDLAYSGAGDDRIFGEFGNDTLHGDAGNDTIYGFFDNDLLYGHAGDDDLIGEFGLDTLYGDLGNDDLHGGAMSDLLFGGDGGDLLYGGDADDALYGGADADQLFGGWGRNWLYGGSGNDTLTGDTGGLSVLFGDEGNDTLLGGLNTDWLYGGTGRDYLNGDHSLDLIYGGTDNDTLDGGWGSDRLFGDAEADQLFGGWENDILNGGAGNDTLSGGRGRDVFVFEANAGRDRILVFEQGSDRVDLSAYDATWAEVRGALRIAGGIVQLDLGKIGGIGLVSFADERQLALFSAADFIL